MKFKLVTKNPKRTPLSNEELAEMLAMTTTNITWINLPSASTPQPYWNIGSNGTASGSLNINGTVYGPSTITTSIGEFFLQDGLNNTETKNETEI